MAIAFDNKSSATAAAGNASSLSWSHTTGSLANGILLVAVGNYGGLSSSVSTITYNGSSLTKIERQNDGTRQVACEYWYIVNPASGANTVAVTMSAGVGVGNFLHAAALSFSGVDQASPIDAHIGQVVLGGQSSISKTITVVNANAYIA